MWQLLSTCFGAISVLVSLFATIWVHKVRFLQPVKVVLWTMSAKIVSTRSSLKTNAGCWRRSAIRFVTTTLKNERKLVWPCLLALFRTKDGFGNNFGRILLSFDLNMIYIKKSCQYFNRRTSSHASLLLSLFVCDLVSHGSFVLRFGSDGAHFILYLCT